MIHSLAEQTSSSVSTVKDVVLVITSVGSMLIALSTIYWTYRQKVVEEERKGIQDRLNTFFAPTLHLMATSRVLYENFKHAKGPNFRTLIELLNGRQFTGNDAVLLDEILRVNGKLDELVYSHRSLIDNPHLQELLSMFSAHYRILLLAKEGKLKGEAQRFDAYVYPRELDEAVDLETKRLRSRLDELKDSPFAS